MYNLYKLLNLHVTYHSIDTLLLTKRYYIYIIAGTVPFENGGWVVQGFRNREAGGR